MLRFPRLALAAALLLPAAAPAQNFQILEFPGGGGRLYGDALLPITWEGKPAFLVVIVSPRPSFLQYDWETSAPFKFRPVAGYFQDSRACAAGMPVVIRYWIEQSSIERVLHDFGDLGKDGTLLSVARAWWPLERTNWPWVIRFDVELCSSWSLCNVNRNVVGGCHPYQPHWPTGLSAFVLALEV